MIPCQRHLFDIPDDVAYLNCAYMSPLMRSAREVGLEGAARKCRPWEILPRHFFDDAEIARTLFARLIGARADDIAIVASASYGVALAAANLALARGQRLIVLDQQFPSNLYAWRELARERGAELVTLARPDDDDWTALLLATIDERVAVVALPHCHWTDGALLDLARVGARCREAGAALVIDATQSLGALPFEVSEIDPDFLVAATYKWLLGPYGLGFLYVAPRHHEGRPLEHNWIDRLGSEEFSGLVEYRDAYQPGARRYDVGERGNFHVLPMTVPPLRQLLEWGVDAIQATLAARTDGIAERARALGIEALPRRLRAGHYLGLRFPGGVPEGLAEGLAAERVYVSVRGRDAVRVTPHLWVNDADEERLFAVLEAKLAGR
ncbi:MAG: aminotransferase class V-fold PLP-dependent enzyme [Alphaproteobacteria bacterium]